MIELNILSLGIILRIGKNWNKIRYVNIYNWVWILFLNVFNFVF